MTDETTDSSILPDSSSELEKKLDSVVASRLNEIKSPVASLWSAKDCPAAVLPFLAWSLSADYWQSSWSEQIQRSVVDGLIDYHRLKGTRAAVENAIADLGLQAEINEWWQMSPEGERGTFDIDIIANQTPLSEATAQTVDIVINKAKRLSQHLRQFNQKLQSRASLYVGGLVKTGETLTVMPFQTKSLQSSLCLFHASGARVTETIRIYPKE